MFSLSQVHLSVMQAHRFFVYTLILNIHTGLPPRMGCGGAAMGITHFHDSGPMIKIKKWGGFKEVAQVLRFAFND